MYYYENALYSISFAWRRWIFENQNFNALNLLFKNVVTAGRLKCCGMENLTVVAHGCRKTINMWHGREQCGLWPPAFPRSLERGRKFTFRFAPMETFWKSKTIFIIFVFMPYIVFIFLEEILSLPEKVFLTPYTHFKDPLF